MKERGDARDIRAGLADGASRSGGHLGAASRDYLDGITLTPAWVRGFSNSALLAAYSIELEDYGRMRDQFFVLRRELEKRLASDE